MTPEHFEAEAARLVGELAESMRDPRAGSVGGPTQAYDSAGTRAEQVVAAHTRRLTRQGFTDADLDRLTDEVRRRYEAGPRAVEPTMESLAQAPPPGFRARKEGGSSFLEHDNGAEVRRGGGAMPWEVRNNRGGLVGRYPTFRMAAAAVGGK